MRRTLLVAAALLLALQGCSADEGASRPPVPWASTAPATDATSGMGGAPAPAGALDGKRQVLFLPRLDDNALPDAVLAVIAGGRIQVTDNGTGNALFVLVPRAGGSAERLIKTATPQAGGEPLCLRVSGGAAPLTVVTTACDPGEPAQLFTFDPAGEDDDGRAVYAVRNRDAFLQWHPLSGTGLIAEKLGDARPQTTFTLFDQGAAALPDAG